jgi:probable HAF family extracellular repeat protein
MLAGCGSQAAGSAGTAPDAHAVAYLLFPLALSAALPGSGGSGGSAGTPDAAQGPAQPGRRAVQADDMAPGAAGSPVPDAEAPVVRGINQTEQIIGSYRLASGEKRAFLWTASHGMRDLNDLVRNKPSDLTLSDALAISDAGAIVVKGNAGLFLLRPMSRAVSAATVPSGD